MPNLHKRKSQSNRIYPDHYIRDKIDGEFVTFQATREVMKLLESAYPELRWLDLKKEPFSLPQEDVISLRESGLLKTKKEIDANLLGNY